MNTKEFEELLKRRMELEKQEEQARDDYWESWFDRDLPWMKYCAKSREEILKELEEVEAQIAAAIAEEEGDV